VRVIRISEYDRGNGWLKSHGARWRSDPPPADRDLHPPAGAARVPLARFTVYTFLGSFLWALGLAWVGSSLGAHWGAIRSYARGFDLVIGLGLVALFLLWLRSHIRSS
jgi:hypothetical protein